MTAADDLIGRYFAAGTEGERQQLLASTSPEVLELVAATIAYQEFCAAGDAQLAAFADFSRQYDAADDAGQLRLLKAAECDAARGPEWLKEWAFARTADASAWCRRYLDAINAINPNITQE